MPSQPDATLAVNDTATLNRAAQMIRIALARKAEREIREKQAA
jgi:hypothetical protein